MIGRGPSLRPREGREPEVLLALLGGRPRWWGDGASGREGRGSSGSRGERRPDAPPPDASASSSSSKRHGRVERDDPAMSNSRSDGSGSGSEDGRDDADGSRSGLVAVVGGLLERRRRHGRLLLRLFRLRSWSLGQSSPETRALSPRGRHLGFGAPLLGSAGASKAVLLRHATTKKSGDCSPSLSQFFSHSFVPLGGPIEAESGRHSPSLLSQSSASVQLCSSFLEAMGNDEELAEAMRQLRVRAESAAAAQLQRSPNPSSSAIPSSSIPAGDRVVGPPGWSGSGGGSGAGGIFSTVQSIWEGVSVCEREREREERREKERRGEEEGR